MGYMALYRKLRPGTFGGVIGQDHIVRTLVNQIESGRISHAYLFCGTRGTGKTSTAKIFAKAVNCENLADGEPCNVCESCLSVNQGRSMNVIEIDAASNNGVDNIREIREEVKYPPAVGKYKVYIIDEVHMLSTGAFNALLKTLEEPPEHVIFVLATTDPQKIPATIHSRCQRFDFRRISSDAMSKTMREYMQGESVAVSEDALRYISRVADGAMRDALSVLDQCISFYYNEEITLEKVLEITGSVDNSVFFSLCTAISAKDSEKCLEIIEDIVMKGRDISQFVSGYVTHLRNLLVSKAAGKSETALDFSMEIRAELLEQAKRMDSDVIIEYINIFSELQSRLKYASNDRILLEVYCIRVCNPAASAVKNVSQPQSGQASAEMMERIKRLEDRISKGVTVTQKAEKTPEPAKEKAIPADMLKVLKDWNLFRQTFPPEEAAFLEQTKAAYMDDQYLYIVCPSLFFETMLRKKEGIIKKKLAEAYGKEFELNIIFEGLYNERHRNKFSADDSFDYSNATELETLQDSINMDMDIED